MWEEGNGEGLGPYRCESLLPNEAIDLTMTHKEDRCSFTIENRLVLALVWDVAPGTLDGCVADVNAYVVL